MTDPRPLPVRVALLGFSDFERTSLTTYFRLAAERDQRYELVNDLTSAELLVADADHAPSVQLLTVTERLAETVFIGSQAPPGAVGSMRRPIDTLHVVRALDALANRDHPPLPEDAAAQPAPLSAPLPAVMAAKPPQPAAPAPAPTLRVAPLAARAPQQAPAQLPRRSSLTAPRPAPARPAAPASARRGFVGPPAPPRALLVDDSALALRFLASRLTPWSVRVDAVATSGEALEKLARRAYDFVFLDLELGPDSELDGLALCRQIKRNDPAFSVQVVMVSAHHSEIDRARGSLAGCDAYLSKPLIDAELATLLRRQGLVPPAAAQASVASAEQGGADD